MDTADMRPSKRTRTAAGASDHHSTPTSSGGILTTPKTRGSSACEKCRSRKTRCNNRRPTCGYCAKNQTPCVYSEDVEVSPFTAVGAQILEAIGNLSSMVSQIQSPYSPHSRSVRLDVTPISSLQTMSPGNDHQPPHSQGRGAHLVEGVKTTDSAASYSDRSKPQGMESVLEWDILAPYRTPACLFNDDAMVMPQTQSLPSIHYRELSRLVSKYVVGVHLKNPILDLAELDQLISEVAENGLDWTSRTCLVTLVCAIGAFTQEYQYHGWSPISNLDAGTPVGLGSELELSIQFWNIAVKRLGFVIGDISPIAIQCLCLAGVWSMHQMQPLQAWKFFNLAGASWYSVSLTNPDFYEPSLDSHRETSFTVAQSLYFTIWKSEWYVEEFIVGSLLVLFFTSALAKRSAISQVGHCVGHIFLTEPESGSNREQLLTMTSYSELQLELNLPTSILEKVNFPHTFPLPPNLDHENLDDDGQEKTRGWFYYLAEIAIRHLLNRVLRTHSWRSHNPTDREIRRLLAQSALLETQLHDWYLSLPASLNFEIPDGYSVVPHTDDLTQILRHRYLSCRELIARPFVKLCVDTTLEIEPLSRQRVITLASQGLRTLMLRLSQVAPYRHQGNWFLIRTVATASLILSAVHLSSELPSRQGAQDIIKPVAWRETVFEAVNVLRPYFEHGRPDMLETKRVLDSVLSACQ